MDLDDDALQDRLLEAFDNLEYMPDVASLLHEILIELRVINSKLERKNEIRGGYIGYPRD